MRIAFGCDDIGFPLKAPLIAALESEGHVVLDLGSFSADPVDYPDFVRGVGQAVLRGFAEAGVLVCGSGVGASIAANKFKSVRAAFCHDVDTARRSREEEHANVLCLAASGADVDSAVEIARTWTVTPYLDAEPHTRRVAKIAQIEDAMAGTAKAASDGRPEPATGAVAAKAAAPQKMAPAPTAAAAKPQPAAPPAPAPPPPPPPSRPRGPDALDLPLVADALKVLESQSFLDRLWTKDATLWNGDPDVVRNRLGWLTAPTVMRGHVDSLRAFADEIRRLQFSQVVVLGMGGASLAAEVFSHTFGSKMGFPDLMVLDSTDPAALKRTLDLINLPRTLFLVSSKSGTTAETLALHAFFREQVQLAGAVKPGSQFLAVTDAGTPLDAMARETGFRHTFLNPASIGGRYAALSFFGLVPAALIGVDIRTLIERARSMVERCGNTVAAGQSPAVRLGAALATLARGGRDKVTFVLSEKIRRLGAWIEQLIAASLGKDGKGLIPVVDEPLGSPAVYGADRVFVALLLEGDTSHDAALDALAVAGHAVIRLSLKDPLDLGAEFFRWELAVATAGAILGVNPFDEPDVARAKAGPPPLLIQWKRTRRLPEPAPAVQEDALAFTGKAGDKPASLAEALSGALAQIEPGDYVALQAYVEQTPEVGTILQALRTLLRDRLHVAATLGLGPRYLHSTGQLHKAGPPGALFIQILAEDEDKFAIPGAGHDFSTLKAAQALADFDALSTAGRRVVRFRLLGKPVPALQQLLQLARAATRRL